MKVGKFLLSFILCCTMLTNMSSVAFADSNKKTTDNAAKTTSSTDKSNEKNGWYSKNGKRCYYENGKMVKNKVKKISNGYYYFDKDGYMVTSSLVTVGNNIYYMTESGKAKIGWFKVDDHYLYFKSNGTLATGWLKINDKQYYFSKKDGTMCTGETIIDGYSYTFSSAGVWNGKAGVKPKEFRNTSFGNSYSEVAKSDSLIKLEDGLAIGKSITVGEYSYTVYYYFDSNNKLYEGKLMLDRDARNVYDEYSVYLAYKSLIDAYTQKYGKPEKSGITYYINTDYTSLATWELVELGLASGSAVWNVGNTKITIFYFSSDEVKPYLTVTYNSSNYSAKKEKKVIDTSGI